MYVHNKQQKEFLENRTETIFARLCNGNTLSSWYINAIPLSLSVSLSCLNAFMWRGPVGTCSGWSSVPGPTGPNMMNLQEQVNHGNRLASYSFECLVHSLANTNIEEAYPECNSGVRSQDVFMIFYSIKACNPLWIRNIPSEEVFTLIKTFVAPSPNFRRALLDVLGF